jgi:hypothetical protein
MTVAAGSKPPPLPASLEEVAFEGREGASLAAICGRWKGDVLTVVKSMQAAGLGLDGYDAAEVVCSAAAAPPLEGDLPLGWALVSSAALHYFDGVAVMDERYLVLRRPDGATVAGPMYSAHNDIGDSPAPTAWRVAMGSSKGNAVLLLSSAAGWHSPYERDPDPDSIQVEHAARVCRFELTRFTCDQRQLTVFAKKTLDRTGAATFRSAPTAELPALDPATGTLRPLPR